MTTVITAGLVAALAETLLCPRYRFPFRTSRVGGIRFVRVGRLQLSICITRKGA